MPAEMIRGDARQGYVHPHHVGFESGRHKQMVEMIRAWLRTDEPTGTYTVALQREPVIRVVYEFSDYGTAFALKMRFL